MCFSAEADFVSGAVVGAIGVATLAETREARALPLAALPLGFGLHQVTEGFVWLGLEGKIDAPASTIALHAYVAFAWVLLPLLVPLAVLLVETEAWRRRCQGVLAVAGAVAGLGLAAAMLGSPPHAEVVGSTIRYHGAGDHATTLTALYVIATCGAFLTSSRRYVFRFGIANLGAVALLVWAQQHALTSLWCIWAAVASVLLYLEIMSRRDQVSLGRPLTTRRGAPGDGDARTRGWSRAGGR